MRAWLVGLVAVTVAVAPTLPAADGPAERELAKLDGTWQVVSVEHEAVKAPDAQAAGGTWAFKGGRLVTRTADPGRGIDEKVEWAVKFAAAGKRKSLELGGARPIRAIYLLDGDDLVVCGGAELPPDFTTGPGGSGRMMWVLKRVK